MVVGMMIIIITIMHDEKVVQYDMETDSWKELPQKLEAGRHAILTIPVPR